MNEQEQIKGITRLLEETHGICGNFSGCTNRKCSQCYAEDLYNAGYWKADEVHKEAVKEFAEKVKAHAERCYEWAMAKIVKAEVDNALKEYEE